MFFATFLIDKTLRLLQEGSKNLKNQNMSSTASIICECSFAASTQLISGQKCLNRNGQLCSGCITLENGLTSATSSALENGMDVETDPDDVSSPRNSILQHFSTFNLLIFCHVLEFLLCLTQDVVRSCNLDFNVMVMTKFAYKLKPFHTYFVL